jgi:hypothetical protein
MSRASRRLLTLLRRGGFAGPLDSYTTNLAAAYSLRRLLGSYKGSAIRVREDSGNTEADIGFDSDGNLDTPALLAHCGANSGYVTTWYDQSAASNNATQSEAGRQPRIVDSGVVETLDGFPTILPDGTDDRMVTTAQITATAFVSVTEGSADGVVSNLISAAGGVPYLSAYNPGGGTWYLRYRTSVNESISVTSAAAYGLVSIYASGASDPRTIRPFINGTAGAEKSYNLATGLQYVFGVSSFCNYKVCEMIIWSADKYTNKADLEAALASYYGITIS